MYKKKAVEGGVSPVVYGEDAEGFGDVFLHDGGSDVFGDDFLGAVLIDIQIDRQPPVARETFEQRLRVVVLNCPKHHAARIPSRHAVEHFGLLAAMFHRVGIDEHHRRPHVFIDKMFRIDLAKLTFVDKNVAVGAPDIVTEPYPRASRRQQRK